MRRLAIISGLWVFLLVAGGIGIFANNAVGIGVCLVGWTPVAVIFGYSLKASGLRIAVSSQEEAPAPVNNVPPVERRLRKIGGQP